MEHGELLAEGQDLNDRAGATLLLLARSSREPPVEGIVELEATAWASPAPTDVRLDAALRTVVIVGTRGWPQQNSLRGRFGTAQKNGASSAGCFLSRLTEVAAS